MMGKIGLILSEGHDSNDRNKVIILGAVKFWKISLFNVWSRCMNFAANIKKRGENI